MSVPNDAYGVNCRSLLSTLCIIWIFPLRTCNGNAPSSLKLVYLVFRHGDRSPTGTFPTDQYQKNAWPQGFGQLSQLGMQQEYELGTLIRRNYQNFLNETYIADEVYIRSTDKDRTLMSAYTVLAGLYPPKGAQVWNVDIDWQPIPVHTVNMSKDNLLSVTDSVCDKVSTMTDAVYNSDEVRAFEEQNKDLFDLVRDKAGIPNATLYDILETVPNPLYCEKSNGMTLPDWVTDDVYNQLQYFKAFQNNFTFHTPEIQRLRGGVFLGQYFSHTRDFISNKPVKKMYLYSAHDTTIAGILISLGVWDGLLPPYSSFLALELHQEADGLYYIHVKYKNDTLPSPDSQPMFLNISGCTGHCKLETFYKSIEPAIFKGDWFAECSSETALAPADVVGAAVLCIVLVILVISVVIVGLIVAHKNKKI